MCCGGLAGEVILGNIALVCCVIMMRTGVLHLHYERPLQDRNCQDGGLCKCVSPSHSAMHHPLHPAMRARPSCSLPEGQPKPACQDQPTPTLVQDHVAYAYICLFFG